MGGGSGFGGGSGTDGGMFPLTCMTSSECAATQCCDALNIFGVITGFCTDAFATCSLSSGACNPLTRACE